MKFIQHMYQHSKANQGCYLYSLLILLTYFQFQFPLCVCFSTVPDQMELLTSESSTGNCRQKVGCRHTANANELYACALLWSCWFRVCIIYGGVL